jgi:predicted Zn-dependent protease
MSINALLAKVIFDKNPTNEFYIEESFPLDWMFPHLTPYGIIMKINRNTVPEVTQEMIDKDHAFWTQYSERLIGNWITYDTSIKEICEFAERVYLRHDFTGFKGDRRFIRDDFAQKAFSKLRSAIGWIYGWRLSYECPDAYRPKTPAEQQRLMKEAEFALKQSYAFCPLSPEALYKYVNLLILQGRSQEALLIAETSLKFDPSNPVFQSYVNNLRNIGGSQAQLPQAQNQFAALEQQYQSNPTNFALGLQLASAYIQLQRGDAAVPILDQMSAQPQADAGTLLQIAQSYAQLGKRPQLDVVVQKLKGLQPALEQQYQAATNNTELGFQLIYLYLMTQQTNAATNLADQLVARPDADGATLLRAAQVYNQLQTPAKLEVTLQKLVLVVPTHPETWYDLAGVQAALGKSAEAIHALQTAIQLSQQRLSTQATARDLRGEAGADPRFATLRADANFQNLLKRQ